MLLPMRIVLNLDAALLRRTKAYAFMQKSTLNQVVNDALRLFFAPSQVASTSRPFKIPVFSDNADREDLPPSLIANLQNT
jgi:hypothetical protein